MSYTSRPDTMRKRERALETLVRGIADEYRNHSDDNNDEHGVYLQRKIAMLERIADELGGVRQPPCLDEEIPF